MPICALFKSEYIEIEFFSLHLRESVQSVSKLSLVIQPKNEKIMKIYDHAKRILLLTENLYLVIV